MITPDKKNGKKSFTEAEKRILYGLSQKVAEKHRCSSMYVRHIIKGTRNADTVLAQKILHDLNILLEVLRPEA